MSNGSWFLPARTERHVPARMTRSGGRAGFLVPNVDLGFHFSEFHFCFEFRLSNYGFYLLVPDSWLGLEVRRMINLCFCSFYIYVQD